MSWGYTDVRDRHRKRCNIHNNVEASHFNDIIDGRIDPFLSSENASKLDPFDKSTLAGPDEELGLSVTGIDRFVRLSSFVAIASHINGDRSEKFASNSFIDPSYI